MKRQVKIAMEFKSLNRLNVIVNTLSGNLLPMTNKKTALPAFLMIYSIIVWLIQLVYLIACVLGIFYTPRERVLKDSTVNIVISLEAIVQIIYLHSCKNLLRKLIEKLNYVLAMDNEMLQNITINTVKPLERPLRIYTIASVISVMFWTFLPITDAFRKNEFYYMDYQVPAVISRQPFSINVFIIGVILQMIGSVYTIVRKISLDIYTMHFILLLTAQYKYLRIKFATILRQGGDNFKNRKNSVTWRNVSYRTENVIKQEMRTLTSHHKAVIEMAVMLKKLLSPNIGILYINNVFRFCFLSFMFVTTVQFEKFLIILYTIGALTQFYILCSCIDGLLEASTTVADDVFHENWCFHDIQFQRAIGVIVLANKLECRLSNFRNIDLTLPSFMSILNQAYSVCLLLLKARS